MDRLFSVKKLGTLFISLVIGVLILSFILGVDSIDGQNKFTVLI